MVGVWAGFDDRGRDGGGVDRSQGFRLIGEGGEELLHLAAADLGLRPEDADLRLQGGEADVALVRGAQGSAHTSPRDGVVLFGHRSGAHRPVAGLDCSDRGISGDAPSARVGSRERRIALTVIGEPPPNDFREPMII